VSFPHTPILSYSHILKSYLLRAHTETKSNKWQQYSLFGKERLQKRDDPGTKNAFPAKVHMTWKRITTLGKICWE